MPTVKAKVQSNTYRSALSSTLYPVNNDAVRSHPLMARLLKKNYHLRTQLPRYSSTWDVAKVTSTFYPLPIQWKRFGLSPSKNLEVEH